MAAPPADDRPKDGEPDAEALKRLDARLKAARSTGADDALRVNHDNAASAVWRMVTELVAGLGIGFGIGYGLDSAFGTQPLFLVLFALLGFAAGVRTMLRSADELRERQERKAAERGAGPTE